MKLAWTILLLSSAACGEDNNSATTPPDAPPDQVVVEETLEWTRTITSPNDQEGLGATAIDSTGAVIVCGYAAGTVQVGDDIAAGFIQELSPAGEPRWSVAVTGGSAVVNAVAVDEADAVYALFTFSGAAEIGDRRVEARGGSDWGLAKITSSGEVVWARAYGGLGQEQLTHLAIGPGGVTVVGSFFGDTQFGTNRHVGRGESFDILVAQVDRDGEPRWSRAYGGDLDDEGRDVAVAADGEVYVTGLVSSAVDLGGGPLAVLGPSDAFVLGLSDGGGHVFSTRLGGTEWDWGSSIAVSDDTVVLTSWVEETVTIGGETLAPLGTADLLVTTFDRAGLPQWSRRFGSGHVVQALDVALAPSGDIFVAGQFQQTAVFGQTLLPSAGESDAFVLRLRGNGDVGSARRFGGSGWDFAEAISYDPNRGAAIAGRFAGEVVFPARTVTSSGLSDVYVMRALL